MVTRIWVALATLSLALTTLAACGDAHWGEKAPFSAPAPPDVYAPEVGADNPAQPKGAAVAPPAAPRKALEHRLGKDAYPCTGHPSCDEKSPKDGFVGVSISGVEHIDPNLAAETEGFLVVTNTFEGLIMPPRASGLPYQQGVATSVEVSADGLTYTFRLRPDARWSNGRTVTADDFRYSWTRKLHPATASTATDSLRWIKNAESFNAGTLTDPKQLGIRALDNQTLEVELENPTPFWLDLVMTAHYAPVPREAIEAHGKNWTRPENIVTNGPYHLTDWRLRDRFVLTRSETYWDRDNVRVPGAVFYHATNPSQAETRYETGQIHWSRSGVPLSKVEELISSSRPDFFIDDYLCIYFYNFRTDAPPFDDVRIRRAINMAIDKERLVEHVTRAMQQPADGLVVPVFERTHGYPKPKGDGYDVDEARALLSKAGYPNGKGLAPVTLLYNTNEGHRLMAEFIQRNLKENLGVEVVLQNMEWKSLLKRVREGDFQMARSGWCGDNHPYTMLEFLRGDSPQNNTGYASKEFDGLMARARATVDAAAHMALLGQAEAVLQRDMPVAPLYYYTKTYQKKPVLRGVLPELTNNHPIKYMWWGDVDREPSVRDVVVTYLADRGASKGGTSSATSVDRKLAQHIYGADTYPCSGHPSCDVPSPEDGYVGIGIGGVEFIDPSLVTETEGFLVVDNVFEPLLTQPPRSGMPWRPGVAERWEVSEDGLTYTFHLRADARWTNGRAVTAGDFVYSWIRKLDPATGSKSAETLHWIKNGKAFNEGTLLDPDKLGLATPDPRTLVVTLENPTPFWLNYVITSHYAPVPREAVEQHGKAWTRPENIVSNGPYRLVEWTPRVGMVLEKNPDYWDADSVRIPGARFLQTQTETSEMTNYASRKIQWARQSVPPARVPLMIEEGRKDFFIDPNLCTYYYEFRTDKPPFDDPRVRRAFAMAVDRERLVDHVTRSMETTATGLVPKHFEATLGYPTVEGVSFDPDGARALLSEAGYPNGRGFPPVVLLFNTRENHKLNAEFVQRSLKESLGVDITLENMEWKSFLKRKRTGDFQMARAGWCGIEHPYSFLRIFTSVSANNDTAYKNARFDELLEAFKRQRTTADQMRTLAEADAILQRDMPIAAMFYYTNAYLKRPVLRGFHPVLSNSHLIKYMYWGDRQAPGP